MRVPVFFRQCGSPWDAVEFMYKCAYNGLCRPDDMLFWKEHLLVGLAGDSVRVKPSHGFDTKVVFYGDKEPDYEPGAWSDRISLFAEMKDRVSGMTFDQVAEHYFAGHGITCWRTALEDRTHCCGWDIPSFFVERGITSFECMYDCEQYMRKVVISEMIFNGLDVENTIFHGAERKEA